MKKIIVLLLILGIILSFCGCSELDLSSDNQLTSTYEEMINDIATEIVENQNTDNNKKNQTSSKKNNPSSSTSKTTQVSSYENTASNDKPVISTESRLPNVICSLTDNMVRYKDIANLKSGGFAVVGDITTNDSVKSLIRIFDKNSVLLNQYLFDDGNGFDKIAACSDGGFIAASYTPPCITKLNSNFEVEWFAPYENVEFGGTVHDIEEISPNCYAVLFVSHNSSDFNRWLKISFLNKNGEIIETVDLMKNIDPQDAEIIADGTGGFYLISACNESLTNNYSLIKMKYDTSKATEVAIMHFSADRQLIDVKIIGGGGNDWCEEAAIDTEGNIYIAVGTDWNSADSFWEMGVDRFMPYRRMLVKLDGNGNIIYKLPLSNKGMAVDQVYGIHIKDKKAYVIGVADYFDGYQAKYPCEQISPNEKGNRVFSVYKVCVESNGTEINRDIFRCDINDAPSGSILLNNGSLVITGSVSINDNPFNINFPADVNYAAALFVY